MEEEIRNYLLDILNKYSAKASLDNDEPLITSHLLDSMDVMDLLYFIEEKFEIPVAAHGGDFIELDTIDKIVLYIKKHSA